MRKPFLSNSRTLDYLLWGGLLIVLYAADVLTSGCGNTESRPSYSFENDQKREKYYDAKNGGFFFDPVEGETTFFLPTQTKDGKPITWTVVDQGGGNVENTESGESRKFRLTGFESTRGSTSIKLQGRYGNRPEDVIDQQYSVTLR